MFVKILEILRLPQLFFAGFRENRTYLVQSVHGSVSICFDFMFVNILDILRLPQIFFAGFCNQVSSLVVLGLSVGKSHVLIPNPMFCKHFGG